MAPAHGVGSAPVTASRRVLDLGGNFFDGLDARVASARRVHGDVIDLSKGNPDLATPADIVEALQRAALDPANQAYPPFLAKRSVREAISLRYREDHGVDLDPDTQVTAFHGAHEALMALPQALMDRGGTMVVTDPCYPPYLDAARLAGVEARRIELEERNGFLPDLAGTAPGVLGGARVLLLNYPNNPTGAVADRAFWDGAVEAAGDAGVLLANDFAYASLDFGRERAESLLPSDPTARCSLEIGTLSKTYSMAGWRFGYAVGDADAVRSMVRYQTVAYSMIFGAVQDAAEAALRGDQAGARAITAEYRARRDLTATALRAGGWHLAPPAGGFFLWVRAPRGLDGEELALRLLEDVHVVAAPGAGFGPAGRGWIRISLVHDRSTLTSAARRLNEWLAGQETRA